MITYALMGLIVIFLAFTLLFKAKWNTGTEFKAYDAPRFDRESGSAAVPPHFFDQTNSTAMRGFWCLIVILVHVPAAYQNTIQDMLGSFAYIGVTFFFMTSAYGLKLGVMKNPDSIKTYWRRRLPKLLVPCILVNIIGIFSALIRTGSFTLISIISINAWVRWLLVCYVIFWIVYRFTPMRGGYRDLLICILIIAFSGVMYALNKMGIYTGNTWCPEIYGFIWGMILSHGKDRFAVWMQDGWLLKTAIFCVAAGVLGIAYLKFKPIVFFGDYALKIILGLAIILFMLAANTRIGIGNKISLFLGSISFEVYLLHGTVFTLIAYFVPGIISGAFIVMSITVTVVLAAIVHKSGQPIVKEILQGLLKGKT